MCTNYFNVESSLSKPCTDCVSHTDESWWNPSPFSIYMRKRYLVSRHAKCKEIQSIDRYQVSYIYRSLISKKSVAFKVIVTSFKIIELIVKVVHVFKTWSWYRLIYIKSIIYIYQSIYRLWHDFDSKLTAYSANLSQLFN